MNPMYSPVGAHAQLTGLSTTKTIDIPDNANAVLIQAISQNVRIKLSGAAAVGEGFRITAGNDAVLIPLGGGSISVREETASGTVEYQFVQVYS
jgi:hypothetical protein